ncbi:MAG: 5-formyltetrahydrofolate cyclo-ligase [PVC group bacterium]
MKRSIRSEILRRRNALTREEILLKSRVIAESLRGRPDYRDAGTVMFYVSRGSEVHTGRMISRALREGRRIAVPLTRVAERNLRAMLIRDPEGDLAPGFRGIPEPVPGRAEEVAPAELDLVIVPGIAFDPAGNRLGMGEAYYDAFLKKIRPGASKIALAFECQVVNRIPAAHHDVAVDAVITEERVIDCCST